VTHLPKYLNISFYSSLSFRLEDNMKLNLTETEAISGLDLPGIIGEIMQMHSEPS
jgi:hypothetical protein